jgi:hypothetical protein
LQASLPCNSRCISASSSQPGDTICSDRTESANLDIEFNNLCLSVTESVSNKKSTFKKSVPPKKRPVGVQGVQDQLAKAIKKKMETDPMLANSQAAQRYIRDAKQRGNSTLNVARVGLVIQQPKRKKTKR